MALHIEPISIPTSDSDGARYMPASLGVHPDDMDGTLAGLHGRYRVEDVYRRYVSVCEDNGRNPATKRAWGNALVADERATARRSNGTRMWEIHGG